MRHPLLVAGVVVGFLLLLVYVCTALKRGKKPELVAALHVMASAVGAAGALRMVWLIGIEEFSIQPDSLQLMGEDAIVIFIGAVAMMWISIEVVAKVFKEL